MKLNDFIRANRPLLDAQDSASFVAMHQYPFLLVENLRGEKDARGLRALETVVTASAAAWGSGKFDVYPVTRKDTAGGFMVNIGRTANCDVCLDSPSVSKLHAYFRRDVAGGGGLTLTDVGSSNGTKLNGVALTKGAPKPVKDGDIILVAGTFRLLFQSNTTFWRFARTMKKFV